MTMAGIVPEVVPEVDTKKRCTNDREPALRLNGNRLRLGHDTTMIAIRARNTNMKKKLSSDRPKVAQSKRKQNILLRLGLRIFGVAG
jgi:hypothetical protein